MPVPRARTHAPCALHWHPMIGALDMSGKQRQHSWVSIFRCLGTSEATTNGEKRPLRSHPPQKQGSLHARTRTARKQCTHLAQVNL